MPIVQINIVRKEDTIAKQKLMEFAAEQICKYTSTLPKNIYVYIQEWERENVRKTAPTVLIDWTEIPDRTPQAKKKIMLALTDELARITGENREEIVIIFTDIPLENAMLGGITRSENYNW